MAAKNVSAPGRTEDERERDATKPVQSQGPPPHSPSLLTGPATGGSEARPQNTGNRFHRAWTRQDLVQLMIQRKPDITRRMCTVLGDTGAKISPVTHQYAKEAGFKGHPASIQISGVGTGNKKRSKVQYRVLLKKRDGTIAEFTPYGVDKIIGDAVGMSMSNAENTFPIAAWKLESPCGPIHLAWTTWKMPPGSRKGE
jgi:hypothetical protein